MSKQKPWKTCTDCITYNVKECLCLNPNTSETRRTGNRTIAEIVSDGNLTTRCKYWKHNTKTETFDHLVPREKKVRLKGGRNRGFSIGVERS